MVTIEFIRKCKIFKMLPDSMIEDITGIAVVRSYKAGELLFNVDEPADDLAILLSGRVDILTTKRTQLVPVHSVMPGEAFAFSSMITRRFMSAAKAVENSEVCDLPVEELDKILTQNYEVGFHFMRQLAVLISSRLLKIHYQMDLTGSGFS